MVIASVEKQTDMVMYRLFVYFCCSLSWQHSRACRTLSMLSNSENDQLFLASKVSTRKLFTYNDPCCQFFLFFFFNPQEKSVLKCFCFTVFGFIFIFFFKKKKFPFKSRNRCHNQKRRMVTLTSTLILDITEISSNCLNITRVNYPC